MTFYLETKFTTNCSEHLEDANYAKLKTMEASAISLTLIEHCYLMIWPSTNIFHPALVCASGTQ